MDTTSPVALLLVVVLALGAGLALGLLIAARSSGRAHPYESSVAATSQAVAPVKESLDRFDNRLRQLESSRIEWHTQLREQVESVRLTNESLRRETAALSTALRRPQVRGQWGEMHLKRTAELAGMVERCDFDVQVSVRDGDSMWRPDMVVRLAGGKQVVVDSKVPLDAYLDAGEADDSDLRAMHLQRHAMQLRTHIDALASKSYWKQFDLSPEFVVLFVPGESFLSQALETEPTLLEYAAAKKVVLASPTTLIALLRTVAYAWTQEHLAQNAREIHGLARELHERIGTVGSHLDKLGRSLSGSVESYNNAVGSFESRVLVTARKFSDLHVTEAPIDAPQMIDKAPRPLTAPEFVEGLR
ncbi:MAG: recombination protein RmuC [Nocardioidaceae bacterium]|nr:recombination protein RmuC [Nocardioidaceae bacterium]